MRGSELVSARLALADDLSVIHHLGALARDEAVAQRGGRLLVDVDFADRPPTVAIDEAYGSETQILVVGLIDRVVVGYGTAVASSNGRLAVAMIEQLFVHPEGRGIGVGAELLAVIRRWAIDSDCDYIESQVLPGNRHAKNFFERVGMVTRRMQVSTPLGDGAEAG